ncbi:hypothetical protein [Chamaesiphon polymorphus]|uniref:hypothetical protein n=1 Tax=Chamaesiphon polymorphus TaxID=2107691 RepID=UPI0015E630A9|nr:hypothetical protein [Chamaesiphon polymorphus]
MNAPQNIDRLVRIGGLCITSSDARPPLFPDGLRAIETAVSTADFTAKFNVANY